MLALFSRVLGEPQPDWPPNAVLTGHIFHDAPHGTSLAPELEAFLQAGPPPIVFTLGFVGGAHCETFLAGEHRAARQLGARAVLLVGPDPSPSLRSTLRAATGASDIMAIERAPHSLLFPRASIVVQQCGVGTLAQSLRSGRPMLAVPYSHDQPDNAWRARKLGMSRTIYPVRYRAGRVASALDTLLQEQRYASAASRVAAVVRAENGVRAACDAVERTFGLATVA